ncbi:MAG TPA: hypothetical protein VIY53_16900 [Acidobacteriaceae bacterium]
MTDKDQTAPEPQGFSEHTRRRSGENAHEQGWGLNQDDRVRDARSPQNATGGGDYDYGARDFGDTPSETRNAQASAGGSSTEDRQEMLEEGESGDDAQEQMKSEAELGKKTSASAQANQRISASRG